MPNHKQTKGNTPMSKQVKDNFCIAMFVILIIITILTVVFVIWRPFNNYASESKTTTSETTIETVSKVDIVITNDKQLMSNIFEYITGKYHKVPVELATVIAETTVKLCKEYNMDPYTIIGLMEIESSFNPFAVSKAHARGLLQVRYSVWKDTLSLTDHFHLHSVYIGIESGIKVLLIYLQKSDNNLTQALQKYNGTKGTSFSDKVYAAVGKFYTFTTKNKHYQEKIDVKTDQSKVVRKETK